MSKQTLPALRDLTALVTGSGSGIGRSVAVALASHGARVVVTGRHVEPLTETARLIEEAGGKAVIALVELADRNSIGELGDVVERVCGGRLSFLIHCAGQYSVGSVETMDLREFDQTMASNVIGPFVLTQRLLPSVLRAKGDIVFVSSSAALAPRAQHSAYSASKAALKSLADCLRAEVNSAGVRVLLAIPGRTATPMQAKVCANEGTTYRPELLMQPEDVASTIVHAVMLPRTAELTELQIRHANKV